MLWVDPFRSTRKIYFPLTRFSSLQTSPFRFHLFVPVKKRAEDQQKYPNGPPFPILLKEGSCCQRETPGPDRELGIVGGQSASSGQSHQQTAAHRTLGAVELGLGLLSSSFGLAVPDDVRAALNDATAPTAFSVQDLCKACRILLDPDRPRTALRPHRETWVQLGRKTPEFVQRIEENGVRGQLIRRDLVVSIALLT